MGRERSKGWIPLRRSMRNIVKRFMVIWFPWKLQGNNMAVCDRQKPMDGLAKEEPAREIMHKKYNLTQEEINIIESVIKEQK